MTPPAPTRILVVDDNPDAAESCARLIELLGHQCEFVVDSREALEAARRLRPHVAILDIGLPHLDGWQLAALMRKEFGWEGIRLVALTAYGEDEDRVRSRHAGFDAHVVKPVSLPLLESILKTVAGAA